jgi:Actinobacteria/chloroflexi VLRF1 release factor
VRTPRPRTVEVGAGRLERWITGFSERHPGASAGFRPDGDVELAAPDGSVAVLHPPFPPLIMPGDDAGAPAQVGAALVANARGVPVLRVLMVRRGGYACAVVTGPRVTASKVGSRYVQGRTAAGGWSQQRFARRREGQTQALVGSAIEVAVRVLLPCSPDDALVTGGDRPLLERVLADPRLKELATLPTGPHLEIGDPKSDLVKELPERARMIRILLDER